MSGTKKQSKKEMAREENQEKQEESVQYPPVAQVITGIFKTISLAETDIERHRQELANVRDFDSRNLYERINSNGDQKISADELCRFMSDNFVKGATIENCTEIISEYDSSGDGSLQYEEFLNLVLPAANQGLRDFCLYGRRVYLNPSRPLPLEISHAAIRIFEKEKQLIDSKKELQNQLASNPDYNRQEAFNNASKGQTFISTYGLTQYLERNGFFPRENDLEAILRRCDHSGDKELSQTEFCEAIEVMIPGKSSEQEEIEGNGPSDQKGESKPDNRPHWQIVEDERKAAEDERRKTWMQDEEDRRQRLLQEAEERRAAEESRREQDRKDFESRVEAEKQRREEELEAEKQRREEQRNEWETAQEKRRQEEDARIQAQKEQNQQRYEQISKVVAFLQDRITEAATLDLQKEMLAYHGSFDSLEVFKQLDGDNNGFITSDEFQKYFAEDEDLTETRFDLLINYWNKGTGDRLSYNQWRDGLSSYDSQGSRGSGSRYPRSRNEVQKSVQDNSWRQQLKFIIYLNGQYAFKAADQPEFERQANNEVVRVQKSYTLLREEAQNLWRNIDNYNDGNVTAQQVQRWLEEEAQFTVPQNRIHFIEDAFDTLKRDGIISEKEFMTVLAGSEDTQMDNGQTDQEGQEEEEYEDNQQHSEPEQR